MDVKKQLFLSRMVFSAKCMEIKFQDMVEWPLNSLNIILTENIVKRKIAPKAICTQVSDDLCV